ncbi:translocation/assembly module TamB [Ilyomonas limi]|uniref:Translocation/assembly module TamB n=1 Tax=Ilyomonas limi TaxID=2575867 RepID=A0A4U3KZI8_9BACT|nr:translocation/assembly module TamB [Ilyomonas limi]TKK68078.1 translocation/assembly module TamB [Ilyomonas limi]
MNRIVKRILVILGWIVGIVIFLVLLVFVAIQIPAVQNFAKNKAVAFLEKKIGTKVSIGKLRIDFPERIVLSNIYFEDQHKDTLLAGKEIRVDIALFKLLSNEVNVDYIGLDGIRANIYRMQPDTAFNYEYIVKAFASEQKDTTQKDTTSNLQFHLDKIVLHNIVATFKDDNTGNDVYFSLGNFETHINKFDLDHQVYGIPSIDIANINTRIYQYKPLVQEDTSYSGPQNPAESPEAPVINLGSLSLRNINFNYKNDVSALYTDLNLGELITHPDTLDITQLHIKLKDIALNNTRAKVVLGKTEEAQYTKEVVAQQTGEQLKNPWKFEIGTVSFNNNTFAFDNNANPKAPEGIDFSHLHIDSLTIQGDSLAFTPSVYAGNIRQISFKEQSGFDLRKLQTDFVYSDTGASLTNFVLQTDKTTLQNKIIATWPSLDAISKQPGNMYLNIDLTNSQIGVKDIITFMPTFKRNMRGRENAVLKLNTIVKGYVKDLSIPVFDISGYGNTVVDLSGRIKGLPNASTAYMDIDINQIRSTKADLLPFIPSKELANFRLPDNLFLKGYFRGNAKDFNTQLALRTNRGNIDVSGGMHPSKPYSVKAVVNRLDAGYLLKQEKNVGIISFDANVSGTGTNLKTANIRYALRVLSAQVKGYNYHDLDLNGTLSNGVAVINSNMNDPNITLNLDATADIKPKYPAVKLDLLVDTIDLHALHLVTDTMAFHGHVMADVPVSNIDSLIGSVYLNDLIITQGTNTYYADSLSLIADANAQQKSIVLQSNPINLNLVGQYKLTEIGTALQQTINQYYNLPGFKPQPFAPQNWELNGSVVPRGMLLQFVPTLKGSDSLALHVAFNSTANDLKLSLQDRMIIMNQLQIDSLNVMAQTNAEKLDVTANFDKLINGTFKLYNTALNAGIANNSLDFNANTKDLNDKTQFTLGGLLNQIKNGVQFSLKDSLLLDYQPWDVGENNFIRYDSVAGILVNNFSLSQNGQSLTINSTPQQFDAPIRVEFNNFQIATLTKMAHQDSLLLEGAINGNALVSNVMKSPFFTSDLRIDNVIYKRDTIGNIAVKVNNQEANTYAANVTIQGNNTDVQLNGKYYTGESRMDLQLALNRLNLAIVKPFAAGQLTDIGGALKGNATITGTINRPSVNGTLNFDSAFVIPAITGERLTLPNENIDIDNQGIHFNEFTMRDTRNNTAILNGDILTTDFKNYTFDLNLNALNFQAVNTPKKTDQLFYGTMNIDADIDVTGSMTTPKIDGTLRVNKETDFTLVLPSNDPEVVSREGVVIFVDKDHPEQTEQKLAILDSIAAKSAMTGLDVSANIETDSLANFTVIIDERNGDSLTIRGASDLAGGIDRSGKVSLTGTYTVSDGSYNMSLSVLKKKFDIEQGSTLTWTGDPTSANIDITASYLADTPPIDLMESSLSGRSEAEITRYKEKLPFKVLLHMTGELLKPIITFDITLPEEELTRWPEVDTKLQQVRTDESELNKQVFALLLLGRFVQENPLESSGGGGGIEASVRSSASRLLSEQLNKMAGNLIKGVDLNFDLESGQDYSTGTAQNSTNLNVGVSKKLLNDRIKVNVGSNFAIENPSGSNRAPSTIAGDVSVDYQLSRDGRYLLRVYRRNDYEGVIEGQVVETGVSFILTFDYNKLKELFENRKEVKVIRKRIRQSRKEARKANKEQEKADNSIDKPTEKNKNADIDKQQQ